MTLDLPLDNERIQTNSSGNSTGNSSEEQFLSRRKTRLNKLASFSRSTFRKIRNELAFEFVFVVICCILAIGLQIKVTIAVVLLCLKFAIPDFVTAYLVFRHDPSRSHGTILALLYMATGMSRACQFALLSLFGMAFFVVPLAGPQGLANLAAIGILTGFVCAFVFLACIFPLTLLAYGTSVLTDTKYLFAARLTKLRRSPSEKKFQVKLEPRSSTRKLGIASGISLSVCLVGILFFIPFWVNIGPSILILMFATFSAPFIWVQLLETQSLA